MAGLRPGPLAPKDMNLLQHSRWCAEQTTTDASDVATAIAVHTASTDNTTLAELVAAIATHTASTDNTTAAELASAIAAHEAAANPHPDYTSTAELAAALVSYATTAAVTAAIAALPVTASGVYTPTPTIVTNADAAVAAQSQYLRVGSVVNASGYVSIDPTATGDVQVGLSLPIASAFAAQEDCAGVAYNASLQQGAAIFADVANARAEIRFNASDTANRNFYFNYTYRII